MRETGKAPFVTHGVGSGQKEDNISDEDDSVREPRIIARRNHRRNSKQ